MFERLYAMQRTPIEHRPDRFRGEFDGHHIRHSVESVLCRVRVEWSDGTESFHDGMTGQ